MQLTVHHHVRERVDTVQDDETCTPDQHLNPNPMLLHDHLVFSF